MKPKNIGLGPRVLGQEKFDLVKAATMDRAARMGLGPRMQSPKTKARIATAQAALDTAQAKLAPAPATEAEAEVAPEAVEVEAPEMPGYSVSQVAAILKEAPGRVLDIYDMEMGRPDGPRKGVLTMLKRTEAAKENGDPVLVESIAQALVDLG